MLTNHITTASLHPVLNRGMPTEREHSHYNDLGHDVSKYKAEHHPARRLRFLDHSVPDVGGSLIVRVIVCALALYGLYSLIF